MSEAWESRKVAVVDGRAIGCQDGVCLMDPGHEEAESGRRGRPMPALGSKRAASVMRRFGA